MWTGRHPSLAACYAGTQPAAAHYRSGKQRRQWRGGPLPLLPQRRRRQISRAVSDSRRCWSVPAVDAARLVTRQHSRVSAGEQLLHAAVLQQIHSSICNGKKPTPLHWTKPESGGASKAGRRLVHAQLSTRALIPENQITASVRNRRHVWDGCGQATKAQGVHSFLVHGRWEPLAVTAAA